MKNEIAVMMFDVSGRVAKYQDFESVEAADAHIDKFKKRYPKAFRATAPNSNSGAWRVSGSSLLDDPEPPIPPPTKAKRIAAITEGDDFKKVTFKVIFQLINEVRSLQPGKTPMTVNQYLTFLEGELE